MSVVRTAVIGVGYLGRFHAQKYAELERAQLVAVCDVHPERCQELAQQLGVMAVSDYRSLVGKVNAVSIVAPTPLHFSLGEFFLNHGIHVLMEKPIATTLTEAENLIAAAKKNRVILQVGHLERFNNAFKIAAASIIQPRSIIATRLAPFKLRGNEVSVILDLMIHDIDLILSLVPEKIKRINANGLSVLTNQIDIANAQIEFDNGCVAHLTASRVNENTERKLRVFERDHYLSIDLNQKEIFTQRRDANSGTTQTLHKGDALKEEIAAFLEAIILKQAPVVSGEAGKNALAVALDITRVIHESIAVS